MINKIYDLLVAGIKLKLGGVDVSANNPYPTYLSEISSSTTANVVGKMFSGKVLCPAVAAKYSATQIWNPADSGKNLIVYLVTGYNGTGTVTWSILPNVSVALATRAGTIINNKFGGSSESFELRTENIDALTASPFLTSSISSVTAPGLGLALSQQLFTLTPGTGLRFEHNTVNVAMGMYCEITETAAIV